MSTNPVPASSGIDLTTRDYKRRLTLPFRECARCCSHNVGTFDSYIFSAVDVDTGSNLAFAVCARCAAEVPKDAVMQAKNGKLIIQGPSGERPGGVTQRSNSDRDFGHIVVWSVEGPVHTAEIKGTGAKMIARGNDAWTIYWHDRVVVSRSSGAVLSLGQPDGSFDFYKLPDRQVVESILVSLAENGDALTTLLNGLGFIFGIWDGSTTGQRFARVAEMNRLIADVPSPCNANGWASVVRVLAADEDERAWGARRSGRMLPSHLAENVTHARAPIVLYATQRFVHDYDALTATRLTLQAIEPDHHSWTERLLRTYEANR